MKKSWKRRGLAALAVCAVVLGGTLALGQGDSLISLSYLEDTFYPTAIQQGVEREKELLQDTYDAGLEALDKAHQQLSSGVDEGLHSPSFQLQDFQRGDHITLPSGSGLVMGKGQAVVNHSGAFIDVTDGVEVADGAALQQGHRYLAAEDTEALVIIYSGLAEAGVKGGWDVVRNEPQAAPFVDVSVNDAYCRAVDYVYFNGLFAGMGNDLFMPGNSMDRAMMMTVLYHLAGDPEEQRLSATATFGDVAADQWYATFISWAAEQGVSAGTGGGMFSPTQPVTREQVIMLLYNFATNYMEMTLSERADISGCSDYPAASSWSRDALSWAAGSGVSVPDNANQLYPTRAATRAEVATMLMNFSEHYLQ